MEKCNLHIANAVDSDSEDENNTISNRHPVEIVQGQKSWRRGRISYASGHVQQLEDNHHDMHYFLRSNVTASYKDTIHKVWIILHSVSSMVVSASCTCKAAACKCCSHIVGLLFALEDYTTLFGFEAKTSTSRLKTWNMGRKRGRYPMPVLEATYPHHAKTEPNRKRYFSMPSNSLVETTQSQVDFLKNIQMLSSPSMFEYLLEITYDNYTLSSDELNVLKLKVEKMILGLVPEEMGPFEVSTDQNGPGWHLERRVRITASVAKSFFTAKRLDTIVNDHLWKFKDIANIPAIKYGRDNESKAITAYMQMTGNTVCKAGLVVNKKCPGLGCSPDGLIFDKDGVITTLLEIKCPFKVKNIHPCEISKINGKAMCYTVDGNNNMSIKRNHQYYYQVQMSLAIMNLPSCDFVMWSEKGILVENIKRDENLIKALTEKWVKIHKYVLLPEFYEMRLPRKLGLLYLN